MPPLDPSLARLDLPEKEAAGVGGVVKSSSAIAASRSWAERSTSGLGLRAARLRSSAPS